MSQYLASKVDSTIGTGLFFRGEVMESIIRARNPSRLLNKQNLFKIKPLLTFLALPLIAASLAPESSGGLPRSSGFHRFQEQVGIFEFFERKFPHLITSKIIGTTHEDRPIYAFRISDDSIYQESQKPEVLYMGGTHPVEPLGVEVPIRIMTFLLYSYEHSPVIRDLLSKRNLWFIPQVNPDGSEYYFRGRHLIWKKNRNPNRRAPGDAKGVDLNRNWGYAWGYDDLGSSPDPADVDYRGLHAFSEPETRAVQDFVLEHSFVLSKSYHSFGNVFLYPWAHQKIDTKDHDFFKVYAGHMAATNGFAYGNPKTGKMYVTNGDFDDWMYGDTRNGKRKTYALTVEIGTLVLLPLMSIEPHYKRLIYPALYMAEISDRPERVFTESPSIQHKYEQAIRSMRRLKEDSSWVEKLFDQEGEIGLAIQRHLSLLEYPLRVDLKRPGIHKIYDGHLKDEWVKASFQLVDQNIEGSEVRLRLELEDDHFFENSEDVHLLKIPGLYHDPRDRTVRYRFPDGSDIICAQMRKRKTLFGWGKKAYYSALNSRCGVLTSTGKPLRYRESNWAGDLQGPYLFFVANRPPMSTALDSKADHDQPKEFDFQKLLELKHSQFCRGH